MHRKRQGAFPFKWYFNQKKNQLYASSFQIITLAKSDISLQVSLNSYSITLYLNTELLSFPCSISTSADKFHLGRYRISRARRDNENLHANGFGPLILGLSAAICFVSPPQRCVQPTRCYTLVNTHRISQSASLAFAFAPLRARGVRCWCIRCHGYQSHENAL